MAEEGEVTAAEAVGTAEIWAVGGLAADMEGGTSWETAAAEAE